MCHEKTDPVQISQGHGERGRGYGAAPIKSLKRLNHQMSSVGLLGFLHHLKQRPVGDQIQCDC